MKKNTKKPIKPRRTLYTLCIKRFLDIIFSLFFIILCTPIYLITSIILLLTMRESIIFPQYRPGKNGKIFKLYKFKTMRSAYDKNGNELPDSERVTKFGIFLRKTAIDELPQFFNILKGDMSFVGPRPRLVKDAVFYSEETLMTYSVRPGLTSPIQIAGGRSEASWEEIFESDLNYIQSISPWKDFCILLKTVVYVLSFKIDGNYDGSTKREYYYSDYLLKTKKISKKEYKFGLDRAKEIIKEDGYVKAYNPSLPLVMAMSEKPEETKQSSKKSSKKKTSSNNKTASSTTKKTKQTTTGKKKSTSTTKSQKKPASTKTTSANTKSKISK